jgi:hypothetical protein
MSPEVLEQLDFAQSALCENLLAEDIGDLLDGNTFLSLVIRCGTRLGMKMSARDW